MLILNYIIRVTGILTTSYCYILVIYVKYFDIRGNYFLLLMTFKTHEDEFSSRISSRSTYNLSTHSIESHGHELLETPENNDHLDLNDNNPCTTRQIRNGSHNVCQCFHHYLYSELKTPYHSDIQESHWRHLKWMTNLPNTSLKTKIL